MTKPKIIIHSELCKGCSLCMHVCTSNIICIGEKMNSKGYTYMNISDVSKCKGCKLCAIMCPDAAIEVFLE